MLYRFAGAPAVSGALNFNDANAVSEYARSALLWATQNGILNGVGGDLAAPAAPAERSGRDDAGALPAKRRLISHVEHLLYATQLFLASTSLQRRISSRHRYSLHMPM